MACENPIYINTTNVDYFGFSTTFNPYAKTVKFNIAGYTEFKTGGDANITQINFEVTDPQENIYTGTIDPSGAETELALTGLVGGLLYFGTYHIKGTLVEADASITVIEFDVEVCDNNLLKSSNFIKGCINAEANCLTAKLTITDENSYIYNKKTATNVTWDAKLWLPNSPNGSLFEYNFNDLPYVKNLAGYYTGKYQLSVTSVATYELTCASFLDITYESSLTKTVDCTASICELNCCWTESNEIANGGGQKAGQMQEKLLQAQPYYMEAMGNYICGKNAEKAIDKVNDILGCECTCRQYIIQPAPITLGTKNVFGDCGTVVTLDDNGDIHIHSFSFTFAKGDPTDLGYTITTTQINECTKKTVIVFDYDVFQQNILTAISNNPTFILNWQEVLGIKDCPCDDVILGNTPELIEVFGNPEFSKLQDTNFVKNDIITAIEYKDLSAIVGGDLLYTEYYDQVIQQQGVVQIYPNQDIILPCTICGDSIANKEGYKLVSKTHSSCGCEDITECDLSTLQVPYSERYDSSYRFNPQIEDAPTITYSEIIDGNTYTMTKLYMADTDSTNSLVRAVIFKTDNVGDTTLHETRTIMGAKTGAFTPTINNTWGNFAVFDRPSSMNLDMTEIVNGEPVLYFVTYAGYVCRAVRERSSECDERANWKVYVIGTTGNSMYGMKKWITDANGNYSFVLFNSTTNGLYSFTYSGTGSKNDVANWTITNISISVDTNFNIELTKKYLFTLSTGLVKIVIYIGTSSIADIMNPAKYNEYDICANQSPTATGFTNGIGLTADVWQPTWIQKITVGIEDRYYFGNLDLDISNNYIKHSYIRYFVFTGSDETNPSDWTFYSEINPSNNSILSDGTWGVSTTNVNGASQGMTYIADLGWVSGFIYGLKVFDFDNKVVTIISGQAVANGDLVIDEIMDTQFEYLLDNCTGGGSGE